MKRQAYRIHIRDLVLFAHHGVFEQERALGQRFVLNVDLRLSPDADAASDGLDGKVNYASVHDVLRAAFTSRAFQTLEACATHVAGELFAAFPLIAGIDLRIDKPSVPIDCACASFGVSLSFER